MQTLKMKRLGVLSTAIFQGAAMALMGLIIGLIMVLVMGVAATGEEDGLVALAIGGPLMIIIIPVMYGIMGFIGGALGALIYNLVAKMTGGIEFDVEKV